MAISTKTSPLSLSERRAETSRLKNHWYCIRHGEARSNRDQVLLSGVTQDELTTTGREQIRQSAIHLCSEFGKYQPSNLQVRIISSELPRAKQTVDLLADRFQVNDLATTVAYDSAINERRYGALEGQPLARWSELQEADQSDPTRNKFQAESYADFTNRISAFIEEQESTVGDQTILLVTHCDPIQMLQMLFSQIQASHYSDLTALNYGEWLYLNGLRSE